MFNFKRIKDFSTKCFRKTSKNIERLVEFKANDNTKCLLEQCLFLEIAANVIVRINLLNGIICFCYSWMGVSSSCSSHCLYMVYWGVRTCGKRVFSGRLQYKLLSLPCWCVLYFFLSQFCWSQQRATISLCALTITTTWEWSVSLSLSPPSPMPINSLGPLVTKKLSSAPMSQDHLQIMNSKAKPRLHNGTVTATRWPCLILQKSLRATQPSCADCLKRQPELLWRKVGRWLHLWLDGVIMIICEYLSNMRNFQHAFDDFWHLPSLPPQINFPNVQLRVCFWEAPPPGSFVCFSPSIKHKAKLTNNESMLLLKLMHI